MNAPGRGENGTVALMRMETHRLVTAHDPLLPSLLHGRTRVHANLDHELDLGAVDGGNALAQQAQVGAKARLVQRTVERGRVEERDAVGDRVLEDGDRLLVAGVFGRFIESRHAHASESLLLQSDESKELHFGKDAVQSSRCNQSKFLVHCG